MSRLEGNDLTMDRISGSTVVLQQGRVHAIDNHLTVARFEFNTTLELSQRFAFLRFGQLRRCDVAVDEDVQIDVTPVLVQLNFIFCEKCQSVKL